MSVTSFDERMKQYEWCAKTELTPRLPVLIRVDGKAFHTMTKKAKCEKPFDVKLHNAMVAATKFVCNDAQGAVLGYTQSDEISILLINYKNRETDSWFDNKVQKIVSVAASAVTWAFTVTYQMFEIPTLFDARVWVLPHEEVCNYGIWRQKDCIRNSVSGLAQANFSHKQLHKKNSGEMRNMLLEEKGIDWEKLESWKKHGSVIVRDVYEKEGAVRHRWIEMENTPIFNDTRSFIDDFVNIKPDLNTVAGRSEGDMI
jgi:tRNA(His) 5'-end guanylyltransferase